MAIERSTRTGAARPPAVAAPSTAPSAPGTVPSSSPSSSSGPGTDVDVFDGVRDMRSRVGAVAVGGATFTAVPALLDDWRQALLQAAAEKRADDEVIAPVLGPALQQAEQQKGEPLTRREGRGLEQDVRTRLQMPWDDAYRVHLADVTKSPAVRQQVERDVLLAERPRIAGLKDPFTPVIGNAPGARDQEIVLWENKNALVLVDTFAPSPKALVVPRASASLPVDLPKATLDELARLSAHVSDAFLQATGCPAAGIWVNPPQHLTVRQLHVHVLPDVGPYTADGAPARVLLEDAAMRPQLIAWFAAIGHELAARLGPPT
jgi:diadenosine tetraphosphate (Ap4A) HIT family hydrolase